MKAWTDYPFLEFGAKSPMRQVDLIAYDRNKYVKIQYGKVLVDIKSEYLYKYKRGYPRIKLSVLNQLPSEV